jgi:hypothetical protein
MIPIKLMNYGSLRKMTAELTVRARQEHLEWCKERALEYVAAGDVQQAFSLMASDLNKHPETAGHTGALLGAQLMLNGYLETPAEMRKWIKGFN